MRFCLHRAFFSDAEQFIHQAQNILIVFFLPLRAGEGLHEVATHLFDGCEVVADHKRADSGAADDHHLMGKRVENDLKLTAGGEIPSEDHHKRDDNSDNW